MEDHPLDPTVEDPLAVQACSPRVLVDDGNAPVGIPSGAVMAFNLAACPSGWSPFLPAVGRTVIRLGAAPGLTTRTLLDSGGSETHTLTIGEMPSHRHGVYPHASSTESGTPRTLGAGGGDTTTTVLDISSTGATGSGQPHNNMPPFIALLYCEKD